MLARLSCVCGVSLLPCCQSFPALHVTKYAYLLHVCLVCVLQQVSGVVGMRAPDGSWRPCLFAVLGPSGAGKTTLIEILAGRKKGAGKTLPTNICFCLGGAHQKSGVMQHVTGCPMVEVWQYARRIA